MPVISDYEKKKKEGYYDWKEVDNPIPNSSDTVMIPEHGNHQVFEKGGSAFPPPGKNTGNKKSSGKKYFY